MTGWSGIVASAAFAAAAGPVSLDAHDSLYHYAEIGEAPGGGGCEMSVSIHAAELATARSLGAAPDSNDLIWLRGGVESAIATLLAEARALAATCFTVEIDDAALELDSARLRFPSAASLRERPEDSDAARPGFLVGTLQLPSGAHRLVVRLSPDSGKRLLLVVRRPGAFPLVRDLAPGESEILLLESIRTP